MDNQPKSKAYHQLQVGDRFHFANDRVKTPYERTEVGGINLTGGLNYLDGDLWREPVTYEPVVLINDAQN